MSRRLVIAGMAGVPLVALAIAAAVLLWPSRLPELLDAPRNPILPDLAMSPLSEISAGVAPDGDRYVSFTASIGNVGEGPLIVHALRTDERAGWRVTQRLRERGAPTSELLTPARLVYGGHGHNHWHVQLGASYWLTKTGSDEIERSYPKAGYCFFDQSRLARNLSNTSTVPTFGRRDCDDESKLQLEMGLSPGFADPYHWTLPDQRLLVTGLEDGVYRLWADADPGGWFRETNESNNRTWVDVRLTLSVRPPRVEVVRRGPAGAPAWIRG